MPVTLSRPRTAAAPSAARAASHPIPAPAVAPAGATLCIRSRLLPASSTAHLTIGQPPRPRLFEHESLDRADN